MNCQNILIPKEYATAPFFASKKQKAGRKINVSGKCFQIGGFSEISEDRDPCPALDVNHARALFTLLTFTSQAKIKNGELKIKFSLNEFCKRYSNSTGALVYRRAKALLSDLSRCWIAVTNEYNETERYRLLKDISVKLKPSRKNKDDDNQQEMWFDEVELHPKIIDIFKEVCRLTNFNLAQFMKIRSPLAQAIYTYIPSRAVHKFSRETAFKIKLETLLTQVGHSVPSAKSLRKQLFLQNKNSILSQLNDAKISGGMLKVDIKEASDKSDYVALFWCEKDLSKKTEQGDTKRTVLYDAWIQSGKSKEEFNKRISGYKEIDYYQREQLEKINVDMAKFQIFLENAIALIGRNKFDEVLSCLKADVIEGNGNVKDPSALLTYRIKDAILN